MIHVITNIQRPSPDFIKDFSGLASATIHEAYGRKGYIGCAIKPINRGIKICGPAFTVQCATGDNIMLHKALERAQPGDVIVAIVGGAYYYGYFGSLMATSAIAKKLGGLCIDGCIRDSAEIIASGFPVFARGFCIRGTSKSTLGLVNYPTVFGGQTVFPGDLIIGDDDGLVVVKREDCSDVLEKSRLRIENEKVKEEALKTGISSVTYNKLEPIFDSVGLVEEK
jgi:4-hydroxy-4-methyl-2-oxoglutarate aldolase